MKTSTSHLLQTSLTRLAGAIAVLLALGTIAGCTRGSQGIFATIEVEEETKTSNLVDNTSATALVRADLGDGERFVVRAGSKIFTRPNPGSDWSAITAPSGYLPVFLAGINTNLSADGIVEEVYGVFFDSTSDRDYLYELEHSNGSLSWNQIDNDAVWDPAGGERITGFEGVADRLLLSSSDGRLYSIPDGVGSRIDLGAFAATTGYGIRAVATNDGGTTVVLGDTVYVTGDVSNAGSLSAATTTIDNAWGVTAFPSTLNEGDSADTFMLVTGRGEGDGQAYTSTDGDTWIEADPGSNIPDRAFWGIAWVDHRERLVVGTIFPEARGYYEVTTSPSGAPYTLSFSNDTISDNYDGSELATSGIARFVYYSSENTLFALTHGRGLWRTAYEASGPEWFWE